MAGDLDELDERFEVPLVTLRTILDRLEEAGLVISLPNDKGYVPGRALEHIELAELLAMFDGEDHGTDTLGEVFAELDQHQRERLAGLDLRECVRRELERSEQAADEQAEEPERALEPTLTA
ncbi:MAG: Rrf2 family transcriptional regulator [Deltaproteobacteria bacterium]|nr:Rrf2 family transcriptional regulator [Deltaproteobacteria bacterium]